MVEAEALGVSGGSVLEALRMRPQGDYSRCSIFRRGLAREAGKAKREFPLSLPDESFASSCPNTLDERLRSAIIEPDKHRTARQSFRPSLPRFSKDFRRRGPSRVEDHAGIRLACQEDYSIDDSRRGSPARRSISPRDPANLRATSAYSRELMEAACSLGVRRRF